MKNKFLLLATTAILSAGALMANADTSPVGTLSGESVPVQAKAEIIHARSLSATPLDFGKIVVATNYDGDWADEVQVTIDRDGNETIDHGFYGYILQEGSKGVVTGATCEELNWTQDLEGDASNYVLNMTKPAEVTNAYVHNLNCYTDNGEATFYGKFYAGGGDYVIPAGEYSGSFTVTVIEGAYPVDDGE